MPLLQLRALALGLTLLAPGWAWAQETVPTVNGSGQVKGWWRSTASSVSS